MSRESTRGNFNASQGDQCNNVPSMLLETPGLAFTSASNETSTEALVLIPERRFRFEALPAELRASVIEKLSFVNRATLMRTSHALRNAVIREGVAPKRLAKMFVEMSGSYIVCIEAGTPSGFFVADRHESTIKTLFFDIEKKPIKSTRVFVPPLPHRRQFVEAVAKRAVIDELQAMDLRDCRKLSMYRKEEKESKNVKLAIRSVKHLRILFDCFDNVTKLLDAFKGTQIQKITFQQSESFDPTNICLCRNVSTELVQTLLLDHPMVARAECVEIHITAAGHREINPLALKHSKFAITLDREDIETTVKGILNEELDSVVDQLVIKRRRSWMQTHDLVDASRITAIHQRSAQGKYVVTRSDTEIRALRASLFDALPEEMRQIASSF